jgi:transposase
MLKETLAQALDYMQPARAERALKEWLAWASRSRLAPFVKVARSIRKHFQGILGYVRHRLTNAVVEGFNTRLRMARDEPSASTAPSH